MCWHWASASVAGSSHVKAGLPLQDVHLCRQLPGGLLVAVLSDGAGSASHGRQGAALACRGLMQAARRHAAGRDAAAVASCMAGGAPCQDDTACCSMGKAADGGVRLPADDECRQWLEAVRRQIERVACHRGLKPRDFSCTLVMAISAGTQTLVLHVGDGGAVVRCADTGTWHVLSWPQHGEYASTTAFVTDQSAARLRTSRLDVPVDSLVLFSDGLERQVLDMVNGVAFEPFFAAVSAPVRTAANQSGSAKVPDDKDDVHHQNHHAPGTPCEALAGRLPALSGQLAQYLRSQAVTARTDDDITLVVAVRA